jgi:O-methyltransferase involved in polyketide biosynthesis
MWQDQPRLARLSSCDCINECLTRKESDVPVRIGDTSPAAANASTGHRPEPDPLSWPSDLISLRADFRGYRIWQETIGDRVRYIARSLRWGVGPHTVVTADMDELRAILQGAAARLQPGVGHASGSAGTPNIAGMYDCWLGGREGFEADRLAADAVGAEFPQVAQAARANRDFVARAVAHVAAQGVSQYLDIGAGLPASPAVHEIVQAADPAARVVYLDNDPVVVAHLRARTLLAGPGVVVVAGDVRQPGGILTCAGPLGLIDLGQPVCVILAAVLHFVTPAEADAAVAALTAAIAPGSYLILSAGTSAGTDPVLIGRLQAAYAGAAVVTGRAEAEIAGYFAGLDLEPPGLTDVWAWRSGTGRYWRPASARILGAVGRKPAAAAAVARTSAGRPA